MQRDIEFNGQFGSGAENLRRAGIDRVRRNRWNDQGVTFPPLDVIAAVGDGFFIGFCIGSGKLHHRLRTDCAHACFGRGVGNIIFEVIHISKTGCAAADHLGAGQFGAQAHEIRRNKFTFNRHHVALQPDVQAQIVRQAAQQRHGDVRVRVDQAWHQQPAAAIYNGGG